MQRSVTRANNATQKASKTRNMNDALDAVQDQIKTLARTQKENMQKMKTLKTAKSELRSGKGKKGNLKTSASKAESNSSGKVTGHTKHSQVKAAAKVARARQTSEFLFCLHAVTPWPFLTSMHPVMNNGSGPQSSATGIEKLPPTIVPESANFTIEMGAPGFSYLTKSLILYTYWSRQCQILLVTSLQDYYHLPQPFHLLI
jgi:hypothetical protein